MPAIQLARLKIQAARLSEKFHQPDAFVRELNELFDFYTNRTIRSRQIAQRLSLPTFRTPLPVMRQVQAELGPLAEPFPAEAIALTRALWDAGSLESRLLAAYLLGIIPPAQSFPTLAHLPDWLAASTDREVRTALLTDALARLRRENPDAFFILLEDWLKSPQKTLQGWGLRALIPILTDPHFENLPAVFHILKPAILSAGPITQLELQDCLASMERVSPTETLAYLREIVSADPPLLMLRTLRRMLPRLPADLQPGLREMLRERDTS